MNTAPNSVLRLKFPNYKPLGLRKNPFPMAGLARVGETFPLIDPELDGEIHQFISATLHNQEYCGLAILGEYGAGKTYTLRYIQELLRTSGTRPTDTEEVLTVYIERPHSTMLGLVSDVCDRIGRSKIQHFLLDMIFADLAVGLAAAPEHQSPRAKALVAAFEGAAREKLFSLPHDLLQRFASPEGVMNPGAILETIWTNGGSTDFLLDFASQSLELLLPKQDARTKDVASHLAEFALSDSAKSVRLWKQLLAGKITSRDRSLLTVSAKDVWSYVRIFLLRTGYRMVYWLIDELEELGAGEARNLTSLRAFLADFRDLIDANLEGFAVVLASKPVYWELCQKAHVAFPQRFSRLMALPPNSREELQEMIRRRLKDARDEAWSGDKLSPFTKESIDAVHTASVGNTRVAIEACHILVWHAATNALSEITKDHVQSVSAIRRAFFFTSRTDEGGKTDGDWTNRQDTVSAS
jgi:type II secretory pathway predicted ATPase ExeA